MITIKEKQENKKEKEDDQLYEEMFRTEKPNISVDEGMHLLYVHALYELSSLPHK